MHAEFQVGSPFVPVRQVRFLRFCKQHAEGVWAVVDVSIDANQESSNSHSFAACRRFPSGCIMQDMPNGCSRVTAYSLCRFLLFVWHMFIYNLYLSDMKVLNGGYCDN